MFKITILNIKTSYCVFNTSQSPGSSNPLHFATVLLVSLCSSFAYAKGCIHPFAVDIPREPFIIKYLFMVSIFIPPFIPAHKTIKTEILIQGTFIHKYTNFTWFVCKIFHTLGINYHHERSYLVCQLSSRNS